MKIDEQELRYLEILLNSFQRQSGNVRIEQDATNCGGACYMSCVHTCRFCCFENHCMGSCSGTCVRAFRQVKMRDSKMKIHINELLVVEKMLGSYCEYQGDIAIKHDVTNLNCDGGCYSACAGSCYMFCMSRCGGGCAGSCNNIWRDNKVARNQS